MIAAIRRKLAMRRLRASMKPDRAYWKRRLAQLSPEHRLRQLMSAGMHSPELWEK